MIPLLAFLTGSVERLLSELGLAPPVIFVSGRGLVDGLDDISIGFSLAVVNRVGAFGLGRPIPGGAPEPVLLSIALPPPFVGTGSGVGAGVGSGVGVPELILLSRAPPFPVGVGKGTGAGSDGVGSGSGVFYSGVVGVGSGMGTGAGSGSYVFGLSVGGGRLGTGSPFEIFLS